MSSLRQILAEKIENKNHEVLLKHPVYTIFGFIVSWIIPGIGITRAVLGDPRSLSSKGSMVKF